MGIQIETVRTDSFSMDFFRFGHGDRTLVILPGLSVQSVMGAADAIAEAYQSLEDSFTIYVFDRRRDLPAAYSVSDMARDTAEAFQALGLKDVCVFGASQGGMIALVIAIEHPELIRKMALGSTSAHVQEPQYRVLERWAELARRKDPVGLYLAFGSEIYPPEVFEQYRETLISAAQTVTDSDLERFVILVEGTKDFNIVDRLDQISCPVLAAGVFEDGVLDSDATMEIAEKLDHRGDFRLYMYVGYGHAAFDTAPDSAPARELREYVAKVTDPKDEANFIPVKDRIAVFDMDGTLTCETYYTYYDTMMFIEYCLNDHPERVSNELKRVAASIKPGYTADENLARNFARAYAGMTMEEFYDYAVEFGQKKTASFQNMRYIDNFYLPMAELVRYLYENGFTIYVISGTERTTTRAIVANSPIRDCVTPNHVIGTDFEVKQRGCETVSSNMDFKYENGDELVITGGFIQKNLNGNKSIYIEREIGQRPVLAFGNSGSDTSMMNYTIDSRNPYPAQAYMIVADDDVREWGTQDWEKKSADYAAKGFIPISMKNDFARICEDGIEKAPEQYQEPDWAEESVEEQTYPFAEAQDALDLAA